MTVQGFRGWLGDPAKHNGRPKPSDNHLAGGIHCFLLVYYFTLKGFNANRNSSKIKLDSGAINTEGSGSNDGHKGVW